MKKIILTLLVGFFMINGNVFAAKIGYINIELLLRDSEQFNAIQASLASEMQTKSEALRLSAEKIKKMVENFNLVKEDLTKEESKDQVSKISKLDLELKTKAEKLKKQFELKGQAELQKVQDKINDIIKEFATTNQFDLILYQEVAFVSDEINITKQIAKNLAKIYKK